ncbi:ATP-binding protein [Accumulibacter sp.]|uniref:ATP-binding protein n=1 Tax=Accumulibacter sp. TaxID=2053492 RepID=UPI002618BCB6|nr:ATP-binding protein [Accumulibacter sp.]
MNRPEEPGVAMAGAPTQVVLPRLADLAFALLATECNATQGAEAAWLEALGRAVDRCGRALAPAAQGREAVVQALMSAWLGDPPASDRALYALAAREALSLPETLAAALSCVAELTPMAARSLIWLQHPVGSARPTVGLLASLCARLGEVDTLALLAEGDGRRIGLLQLEPEERPLCERSVRTPLPLVMALAGYQGCFDGVSSEGHGLPMLPESTIAAASSQAAGLRQDGARVLLLRSAVAGEARAAAVAVAAASGRRPVFYEGEPPRGLGPWLWLQDRVPVLQVVLAPGERRRLVEIPGYDGPLLVATGLEGSIEGPGAVSQWRLPVPPADERARLWRAALGDALAVDKLAAHHRHGAGRIAELGQAARSAAARAGDTPGVAHVVQVARRGVGADLGALAELLDDDIADEALVLAPAQRQALDSLVARCQLRDTLAARLGLAARARYKPGVRALLVGPSGTGKTLAAGWIATRLGLPLYRVDLASVTSKYIGETEKNLAELFGRAEHAEVVLLFDEADSLFGKRTDVKDANDRFANQQTNYLLQRIESFEGITLLTSNSRARFDSAFTRRLDAIVEFLAPGPVERRALWLAHLGEANTLDAVALNRLAANCDLAGGHIRNVVLAAAAMAGARGRQLGEADLSAALAAEYRKLGKQMPAGTGGA